MSRFDGTAARKLDVEDDITLARENESTGFGQPLRLARPEGPLVRPDKYTVLTHRRRQAQIKARHLLEIADGANGR